MNTDLIIKKYYLFQFVSGLHFIGAVLTPFFTDWGGISLFAAQALQSWFTFCIFVLEVPTGAVADIFGRKQSVTLGAIVMGVGAFIYGSIPNLWIFVLAEFLFAAGVALISGADNALLYDTLLNGNKTEEATTIFGKARSYHMAAIAIGAIAGGFIASIFGLNFPMLFTAGTSFLAALIACTIPEPPRIRDPKEDRSFTATLKQGFKPFKENSLLRKWIINAVLVTTAGYFVIWLYQPLMKKILIPIEYYGLAQAFLVVAQVIVASNFNKLVKLTGSFERYLFISALITGSAFLLAAVKPNLATLVIYLALAGGLGLTLDQLLGAELNKFIGSGKRATTLSAVSMLRRIFQSILNPAVGYLTDRSVVYSLIFVAALPLLVLLTPAIRCLQKIKLLLKKG